MTFSLSYIIVTLRIGDNVGTVELHEVGLDEKPRLAAAGAAHHQHVFVPRGFRVLGAAVHGQPLRLGENDVVGKGGVYIRLDVLRAAPSRAAVLDILPKLPRVLPLDVDGKPDEQGGGNAHAQVDGVEAGERGLKRGGEALHDVQRLL